MSTIVIGCKLPNGIVLKGPKGEDVELNGMNRSPLPGQYGVTRLDEAVALFLLGEYVELESFKNNSIFQYGTDSVRDLVDAAADLVEVQTGFEGIDPAGVKENGVKLEPDANTVKMINDNEAAGTAKPRAKAKGKASQAASAELAAVALGA